jgi:hypothetical protein
MIYLGYACNENYRFRPRFEQSVHDHIKLQVLPFALGDWGPGLSHHIQMPMINEFGRPIAQVGHFLDYLPEHVLEIDTILFVDVDAVFQRPFEPDEIMRIANLCKWNVLIGPNRFHDRLETWVDEAPRILPTPAYYKEYNGSFDDVPIGNCGFIAMQVSAYRQVWDAYQELTRKHGHWFTHHAGTQIFLCAAFQACGLELVGVPPWMSAHGHCGTPPGIVNYHGRIYYKDKLVSYAHAL